MLRLSLVCVSMVSAAIVGCGPNPGAAPQAGSTVTPAPSSTAAPDAKPADEVAKPADDKESGTKSTDEKTADGQATQDAKQETKSAIPTELKLDGISFMVPASWKRVEPPTSRIVEAEFTLPRAEGDEFDGRLTLMAAGGDNDANIARWTGEFNQQPGQGPKIDTMKVSGVEATTVDIRGEWKGSSFAPMPPRADYRMLSVIMPFTERNSFYVKFTGPRETVAKHEEAYRDFVKSARIQKAR